MREPKRKTSRRKKEDITAPKIEVKKPESKPIQLVALPTKWTPKRERAFIRDLLCSAMTRLSQEKISLNEFLKLLQVRRELEAEALREVVVEWVEPYEDAPVDKL